MLDRGVQEYQLLQYYTGSGVRSESLGRCQAQRDAAEAEVSEYGSAGRTASCSTASSPCECFSLLDSSHHPISTLLRLKDMIQKAPAALTKKPAVRLKTEEEFRICHLSDLYIIHLSVCLFQSICHTDRKNDLPVFRQFRNIIVFNCVSQGLLWPKNPLCSMIDMHAKA